MCACGRLAISLLLIVLCLSVCLSYSQKEIGEEVRQVANKCLGSSTRLGCPEPAVDGGLGQESHRTPKTMQLQSDVSDPAVQDSDGITEGRERRRKRKKMTKYLLLATAMIAAKAAAVATGASIIVPLALKAITLLAAKALLVGKFALIVVAVVGFVRLAEQGAAAQKTEIILEPSDHRGDIPFPPSSPVKRNRIRGRPHEGLPPSLDVLGHSHNYQS